MEAQLLYDSGDGKEFIFDALITVISEHNGDDYRYFHKFFSQDNFFIALLEKESRENDAVFYFLSNVLQCIKDKPLLFNELTKNCVFHSIFYQQPTEIMDIIYPTLKIIFDKKKIALQYLKFKCLNFLFNCLQRCETVNSKLNDNSVESSLIAKIRLLLSEFKSQLLNHILLIDAGFVIKESSVVVGDYRLTQESMLLPLVIGNIDHITTISKLVQFSFKKTGFTDDIANGFYFTFGTVLMNLHHNVVRHQIDSANHEIILRSISLMMAIKYPESHIKHPIIALMTKLPNWSLPFITDSQGQEFERLTFFGPFLSGSMFADDNSDIAVNHFKKEDMDAADVSVVQKELQARLDIIWDLQFQMFKLMLVEKSTHNIAIDYLNRALVINSTRGHLQPDENSASSEGFITNINAIMQRLIVPIKLDKVDVNYLTYNARSNDEYNLGRLLNDETRINVDKQTLLSECDRINADLVTAEPTNFHTHCFYQTAISHHYGIMASIRKQTRRASAIQSLQKSIAEISRMIEQNQFNNSQLQISKSTLSRYKAMVSYQKRASLCSEIVLSHDTYLRSSLEYFIQVAHIISSTLNHDISTLNSLIESVPSSFSCLPQFFFDDLADFLIYIMSNKPHILGFVNRLYDLISFTIFMSTHSSLIKSPYLVAKFVEVIFSLLPNVNNHSNLYPMFHSFLGHYAVSSGFLTNRLILFYIEVEKTGATSEFYDKFSIRFKISIIFRTLWKQGNLMKIHLLNEVHDYLEKFVKFVNRAMNDMVYLLDESITCLKRIRTNQEKRNDVAEWAKLTKQEQAAILQQLTHDERSTKSQLTLADVTVEMLYDFTTEIKEPFLCSELVDKLAAMLNSFLLELVGPKCKDLKVNEPEKYHWNPKKLLQNLVRIYMNLDSPKLIEAISNEERFYSPKLFTDALSKLQMYNIVGKHEVEHFDNFRQKIESLVQELHNDDADLDDIPAEYLDPIMSSIMKEPVMLPKSRTIVDKSVIKRHLLNDDCDPFNRQPLKLEDLIPQPELQKEIQQWRLLKRANRKT